MSYNRMIKGILTKTAVKTSVYLGFSLTQLLGMYIRVNLTTPQSDFDFSTGSYPRCSLDLASELDDLANSSFINLRSSIILALVFVSTVGTLGIETYSGVHEYALGRRLADVNQRLGENGANIRVVEVNEGPLPRIEIVVHRPEEEQKAAPAEVKEPIGDKRNRLFETTLKQKLKRLGCDNEVPERFCCPITGEPMVNPVVLDADGVTYEEYAIKKWILDKRKSPTNRAPVDPNKVRFIVNQSLKSEMENYYSDQVRLHLKNKETKNEAAPSLLEKIKTSGRRKSC